MKDIEIATKAMKKNITDVAKRLEIDNNIELYGADKAKIRFHEISKELKGKLILVTSINPTPYGEGKTTVSIGLNDGLNILGQKAVAVLREPSLGPVFGIKGGATGGGYSQVIPMEDINLHFTGDFHAVTSANNLIASAIDNHLHFGNNLKIDPAQICFKRCLDINDRALREISLTTRKENFNITAASEIMSILCLSNDFEDLKYRLSNILLAYSIEGKPIYAKDLKIEGSLSVLLKDAIRPNLVQSLENNPVIIHGGPFANIAHGCNSIISTKLGLKLADYVVTEAGFGSDLGAEKFLDIKCPKAHLKPDVIVIVATIKALKYNAGILKDDIAKENVGAVQKGLANLEVHMENMQKYTSHVLVTLNQYDTDSLEEIAIVRNYVEQRGILFSVNDSYQKGGKGSITLAKQVINLCKLKNDFHPLYKNNLSIPEKIEMICKNIYHAGSISYSSIALEKIHAYEELGYSNYPVCIAKTQYSISDDPKKLGYPKNYEINVQDLNIYTGAGFIVVYLGNIMTMPGLPKHPNYETIDIDGQYHIKGLF